HASTVGMLKYVADKGAGFLMDKEIEFLSKLLGEVERPYVAVIGGAKVSDKIGVLDSLAGRVDRMLIGGAMANRSLTAEGRSLGKTKSEEDKLALARSFLKKAEEKQVAILLPRDVVIAAGPDAPGRVVPVGDIPADMMALDIGPETARGYADEV